MNETEKIKFRMAAGREDVEKRAPCNFKILTLNDVDRIIDNKEVDESIKIELKKMARKYPFQALTNFVKNIEKNISKVRKNK